MVRLQLAGAAALLLALPTAQGLRTSADEDALEVAAGPRPLCAPEIVREACQQFNWETRGYFTSDAYADVTVVHAAQLSEFLMIDRSAITSLLQEMKMTNVESNESALELSAFAVKCLDLCTTVIRNLPADSRPPTSDRGCYRTTDGGRPICDVDVSLQSFAQVNFEGAKAPIDAARQFDEDKLGEDDGVDDEEAKKIDRLLRLSSEERRRALDALSFPERSRYEVLREIANAFRIYPPGSSAAFSEETESSLLDVAAAGQGDEHCAMWCVTGWGYVTVLCSKESCSGCEVCRMKDDENARLEREAAERRKVKALKVGVRASAYVANVIRAMHTSHVDTLLTNWFQSTDETTRKEVLRVLKGADSVLNNAEYREAECPYEVFAKVNPKWPKNRDWHGRYIVYLCVRYHWSSLSQQIETLIHEASHHSPAYTTDMCMDGVSPKCELKQKAYGRDRCQQLAKTSSAAALRNADSHCFFANDAFKQLVKVGVTSDLGPLK